MSEKGILGGKIANAVNIHQEALHLTLKLVVMFVLFLMQRDEKLSVIEDTRSSLRPLRNGATSGISLSARGTCIASQGINTRNGLNSFNGLGEVLMIDIVKINWLLCRLWVNVFNRQINLWQEYEMIARRRLIVEGGEA